MKLGKKKFQDLKDGKIQFEDLEILYFIDSKGKIESDNLIKLLESGICNFKQIIERLKKYDICYLLKSENAFYNLIKSNMLDVEDLKYLMNSINEHGELRAFTRNCFLITYLIENNTMSFQEIVNAIPA